MSIRQRRGSFPSRPWIDSPPWEDGCGVTARRYTGHVQAPCKGWIGVAVRCEAARYMHVFDWPANGQIVVTAINLPLRQTGETSVILGPIDPPESIDTVLALETDQEGTVT
jgi:hypothetical protein